MSAVDRSVSHRGMRQEPPTATKSRQRHSRARVRRLRIEPPIANLPLTTPDRASRMTKDKTIPYLTCRRAARAPLLLAPMAVTLWWLHTATGRVAVAAAVSAFALLEVHRDVQRSAGGRFELIGDEAEDGGCSARGEGCPRGGVGDLDGDPDRARAKRLGQLDDRALVGGRGGVGDLVAVGARRLDQRPGTPKVQAAATSGAEPSQGWWPSSHACWRATTASIPPSGQTKCGSSAGAGAVAAIAARVVAGVVEAGAGLARVAEAVAGRSAAEVSWRWSPPPPRSLLATRTVARPIGLRAGICVPIAVRASKVERPHRREAGNEPAGTGRGCPHDQRGV